VPEGAERLRRASGHGWTLSKKGGLKAISRTLMAGRRVPLPLKEILSDFKKK